MTNTTAITPKAKVLLVQSAQTQGNGTRRFLEHSGYDVVWAGSGMSALMAAKNQAVNMILMDFALPDIEGSDLCRRFRSRDETKNIPIILLTARGSAPESFNRPPAGPDDYLAKPFTENELDDRIMSMLRAVAVNKAASLAETAASESEAEGGARINAQLKPLQEAAPQAVAKFRPREAPVAAEVNMPDWDPRSTPITSQVLRPQPEQPHPQKGGSGTSPDGAASGPSRPAQTFPAAKPAAKPQAARTQPASPALAHAPAGDRKPIAKPTPSDPSHMGTMAEVVDASTGLFTRLQFEAMFSKEFKRSVRFKQQMSCMMIDLDGKSMGRVADEKLVKAIIKLVQSTIREVDTAAWWTGDALVVMLPNTLRNDAVQAAARILEVVANHPFTWPDSTKVTMSIGVAGLPDKNIDSEQKMTAAAAMACKRARDLMLPFQKP
ncbi:MAG: diguanylate cyclase [Nitrospirota bacterium]|nr:diguanylate cyclase [Nitrospirota bacterium]